MSPLHLRRLVSTAASPPTKIFPFRLKNFLSTPTWSVSTLLAHPNPSPALTSTQLHHLLRLCALSPPTDESALLDALHDHLHFVRAVQAVDTTGVERLVRIEDQVNCEGITRNIIRATRARSSTPIGMTGSTRLWDPTALAKKKVGEFFVVDAVGEEMVVEEGEEGKELSEEERIVEEEGEREREGRFSGFGEIHVDAERNETKDEKNPAERLDLT